jgi:hypothetical protein
MALIVITPVVVGVVLLTIAITSGSHQRSLQAAHLRLAHPAAGTSGAGPGQAAGSSGAAAASATTCRLADRSTGYVNPVARANVVPERIDQGVDYAGSGSLTAMGAGQITSVQATNSGWPGAFIAYRLLNGADKGCYVFYAEGITPAPGLYVGEIVSPGQVLATIVPKSSTGIEIGWAAGQGSKTYAAEAGEWSPIHEANNIPSAAGLYFSALIASLGGPPGKVEG